MQPDLGSGLGTDSLLLGWHPLCACSEFSETPDLFLSVLRASHRGHLRLHTEALLIFFLPGASMDEKTSHDWNITLVCKEESLAKRRSVSTRTWLAFNSHHAKVGPAREKAVSAEGVWDLKIRWKKGGERGSRQQRWEERLEVKFGVKGREKRGREFKEKRLEREIKGRVRWEGGRRNSF